MINLPLTSKCVAYDGHKTWGKEVYKESKLASKPIDRMLISAEPPDLRAVKVR